MKLPKLKPPARPDKPSFREKHQWLWRHYGVRRLAAIGLGCPLYYATWLAAAVATGSLTLGPTAPLRRLVLGTHDVWFGFWIATVSTPLLWVVAHHTPWVTVEWGFRALAFIWLFDGVVALIDGGLHLANQGSETAFDMLGVWLWVGLAPVVLALAPWAFLELGEWIASQPLLTRWRYSGRGTHAAWIGSRLLRKQSVPFPRRRSW